MKLKFLIVFLFFTNIFSYSIGAPLTGPNKDKQTGENEDTDSPAVESKLKRGGQPQPSAEGSKRRAATTPVLVRPDVNTVINATIYANTGSNYNEGELQECADVNVGKDVAMFAIEKSCEAAAAGAKGESLKKMHLNTAFNVNTGKVQRSGRCNIGIDLSELNFPQTVNNPPVAYPYLVAPPPGPIQAASTSAASTPAASTPAASTSARPISASTEDVAPEPMSEDIPESELGSLPPLGYPVLSRNIRSSPENTEQSRRKSKKEKCRDRCTMSK